MHFEIQFSGHENIRSLHQKTIEITKEDSLTPSGDCIIGVNAFCGCKGLPNELKKKLKNPYSNIYVKIIVNGYSFKVKGRGDQKISCVNPDDIVLRKSHYVCPRTLAVNCDKASDSISREMVKVLQNPKTKGKLIIKVT